MHEGVLECGPLVDDKAKGFGEIVFAHRGLEVGERFEVGLGLAVAPLHEQADDQPVRHSEDPQPIGASHPATVVIEGHIQALMGAVFDPPTLPVGLQPLARVEFVGAQVGLQNKIIDQQQYSVLVTVVILSAFIPTLIAQKFFQPTIETMVEWGKIYRERINNKKNTPTSDVGATGK
jgi:hypothetical protein